MKNKTRALFFIIVDYLLSVLSWILFYFSRKLYIEHADYHFDIQFIKGISFIPLLWMLIFTLQGTYIDVKRLYRIRIFSLTFFGTIIGTLLLFFIVLIDDKINTYENYYFSLSILFIIQFSLILFGRWILTSIQVIRIQTNRDNFKTLLIGNTKQILEYQKDLSLLTKSIGNNIIAIIFTDNNSFISELKLNSNVITSSNFENLNQIINNNNIEEVLIVDNEINPKTLQYLLAKLSGLGVSVKIKASDFDIAIGSIKQNNLFGLLTKEINFDPMPFWQKSMKRCIDIVISIVSLLLLLPFFVLIAIGVKRSSNGTILFKQERIGKNGKPFQIIKFRTMYTNSEQNGPQLSSTHDNRITKFGKFLRKTRIDEFPQFFNVLKGEMSLVGPRPERQYYIDQISQIEPSFLQLTIVKPGITSWGQVKYGYAENVDQMIQRMRFDLLYLKNRSLALDFKIMIYTIITILKAKGK
jgi:exopolysaccharide biosynthesis polyprenyl glycosylphosphotransferase